jgi:hypothetical protein
VSQDADLPLEEYHRAGLEITNGNPEVYKDLYSRRDDVTLANPFGPPARGWNEVSATLDGAAAHYRDGEVVGFDNVSTVITSELAYTVEIEELPRTGRRSRGHDARFGPGHYRLPARGRRLEGDAQARRSDHDAARSRVGNRDVAPQLSASN